MSKVQDIIYQIASFGKQEDGAFSRPFGSLAYRGAAAYLCDFMKAEGLESYIDTVGNVHGFYSGTNQGAKELIIGSHLDTVKEGGMFDGLYGVAAGLAVMLRLKEEKKQLPFQLHLLATNGEEGNRLGGTFGSRCLTGHFTEADWEAHLTRKPLEEFVVVPGGAALTLEDIQKAEYDFSKTLGYLELHIEQGITLEREHKEIGIVTGIVGLRRYRIQVSGQRNHSGTTKMEYRDDALVKAAKIIVQTDSLARTIGNNLVATVQTIEVSPNALAVINGKVEMVLEIRNLSEEIMDSYEQALSEFMTKIPGSSIQTLVAKKPVIADSALLNHLRSVCTKNGVDALEMPSGATHDGNMIALKTGVGMLFVPSKDGISHEKAEWTEPQYLDKGTELLYQIICEYSEE